MVGAALLVLALAGPVAPAGAFVDEFFQGDNITIPSSGSATPFPSTITVRGMCDVITDVNMEIGLSHTFPDDVDILLVAPGGQNAIAMSDAGGMTDFNGFIGLDDEAGSFLPDTTAISSGAYQPTNYPDLGEGDSWPMAPSPSGGSALSAFDGANPNGTWRLFVSDDAAGDTGSISEWSMQITTTRSSEICVPAGAADLGPGEPYPDTTTVSGLPGTVTDVNLTLMGVTHRFLDDVDVLLVGPGGQSAIVMSDAGGETDYDDLRFTLDDQAPGPISDTAAITPGSYQPANHTNPLDSDSWPAPAPTSPGVPALAVFNGTNPNGTWSLFVTDDESGIGGRINDWSLQIATPPAPGINLTSAKAKEGKPLTFQVGLSAAPTLPFSVPFATVAGSAKQGKDFKASSGNLTFNPGETSKTVVVKTKDDRKDEKKKETFSLQLTTATGNVLLPAKIKDNDK